MRYELQVQINGENVLLDTDFDGQDYQASVSLNYDINNIQDISTTNSSYSKAITLPDTKKNRIAFQYISGLNSDSSFDPRMKSKCWVLKDTNIQLEGYIQLMGIDYDRDLNMNLYQTVIYADNANLYTNIGEKYLSDLDLSQFDHYYNPTNVINSWTADYTNGYYYPLADYGQNLNSSVVGSGEGLSILDFVPGWYVLPIVNQIFLEAGYNYISDFLNSDFFKQLYFPYNNGTLISSVNPNIIIRPDGYITTAQTSGTVSTLLNYTSAKANSWDCDIVTYDPNGFYDATNHLFSSPLPLPFATRFTLNFDIVFDSGGFSSTTPWTETPDEIYLIIKRSYDTSGVPVSGWSDTPTFAQILDAGWPAITIGGANHYEIRSSGTFVPIAIGGGKFRVFGQVHSDYLITNPLRPGEQVRFFYMRYAFVSTFPVNTQLTNNNSIGVELNNSVVAFNNLITASSSVPNNVKQKDVITSLSKQFNLLFEPDKNNTNTFRIEPADNFYNKYQKIVDWSTKLDISQPITTQITSNTQQRQNIFSYTSDNDYYNSLYSTSTNKIYGQYEFDFENEFITDVNDINPIFSPTPINLLAGSNNIYLPTIVNYNNGNITRSNGMNIRILYKNYLPVTNGDSFIFDSVSYPNYPYGGPVDNPLNPSLSLSYGAVATFYTNYIETQNNLFNTYWYNTMDQINDKNSRIVTAYFNLNSIDISQFSFADLIFFRLDGAEGYYRVNKINDYDPSTETTTEVELVKAIDFIIPKTQFPPMPPPILVQATQNALVGNINLSSTNNVISTNNLVAARYSSVSGANNIIAGDNHSITGANNNITGTNHIIMGSGNIISGSSHSVSGDNIAVIGGVNHTATQSNVTVFPGAVVFGSTVSGTINNIYYGEFGVLGNVQILNNSGGSTSSNIGSTSSISQILLFNNNINNSGIHLSSGSIIIENTGVYNINGYVNYLLNLPSVGSYNIFIILYLIKNSSIVNNSKNFKNSVVTTTIDNSSTNNISFSNILSCEAGDVLQLAYGVEELIITGSSFITLPFLMADTAPNCVKIVVNRIA